ncbi:Nif3-like dinuclear metal center hexameric protein [Virgibacillus phasianinus]|uniref:GTP cyclohydrolase 1 type 2 homolog n=1 Tax=Virgibacillus phasianinus TaxID=2017483 RepID=A0A220U502_9BACI|nr:Nif3-like dinuclear metal center hexameric protein [Virgibacillus phasianinus]ASK63170.1 Nif3-like dinuclear metal center hexameric protein [Virgibacillus phasianinus]
MKEIITNRDVFHEMEKWTPRDLAYDWDNVGLQLGSFTREVKKVMITLDVLDTVVDEAIENEVDLIIAHHPLLFKSVKQINTDEVKGKIIEKLIKHDITVYAAHTNLDIANGGVNDMLCDAIGMKQTDLLMEAKSERLYKLAVYVPSTHVDIVREALGDSGAGYIGNYSHCTFQTAGTGAFKPLEGTDPFIGKKGDVAKVDEAKLETIVTEQGLSDVLQQMKNAHPYEEAAYDIFPLRNEGEKLGIGRIGELDEEMTLQMLSEHIKQALEVPRVRVTGDLQQKVKRVAVLGGSGADYIDEVKEKGADVYLTGDMSFHHAQDAWQMGLSIIDPGHHVEKVMKQSTKRYLENIFTKKLEVIVSKTNTEPFQFI